MTTPTSNHLQCGSYAVRTVRTADSDCQQLSVAKRLTGSSGSSERSPDARADTAGRTDQKLLDEFWGGISVLFCGIWFSHVERGTTLKNGTLCGC
mmetsp:Transcript_17694/g.49113  ORF Transcript_17694/g.49113 Transcript_17694/m.49113 type:complete len:95 (-) Transcript_17694:188-472(-)